MLETLYWKQHHICLGKLQFIQVILYNTIILTPYLKGGISNDT